MDQHSELKKKAEGICVSCKLELCYIYWCCSVNTCSVYLLWNDVFTAHKVSELDKQKEEEAKILHNIKEASALMSVSELAKGVVYKEPLVTG